MFGAGGFQRFDSLKVEADGRVCIATLQNGGITVMDPRDCGATHIPMPDMTTTNLCFGGTDLSHQSDALNYYYRFRNIAYIRKQYSK